MEKRIEIRKFKNGLWSFVKPRPDTEVVSLQVWFRVGSAYEKDNERGLAHFLEHMVFNGNDKYKYGEAEALIESYGGILNAGTSKEYTYYYINIARPYWKIALDVLFHLTMRATLEEKMIEKEKPIVLEELYRDMDNPHVIHWWEFEKTVYKVSPFRFPIIGFEKTIKNFNRALLLNFYQKFYNPANACVVVVGNIEPKEVFQFIEETFGKEKPPKHFIKEEIPDEPPQLKIRKKTIKDSKVGKDKAYTLIGWRIPKIGTLDDYDFTVLLQILSEGRSSIFYKELREKGIVHSISAYDLARSKDNLLTIHADLSQDKLEIYNKKLFEIFENLYEEINEEMVEKAKTKLINSEIFQKEEVENEASFYGYAHTVAGKINYALYYIENIKKVQPIHIKNVLEKYILKKPYSEVLLLPEN